jgi:carbon monoxide dehydrogenase subunit G
MIRIERGLEIRRPIEKVFTFVANFENEPKWQPGVMKTMKTSEGAIGVGTTFQEDVKFMGRRMRGTYEVVEYDPPRKFSIKATSGPFAYRANYMFVPVSGGTQFTGAGEIEPSGFFRLIVPLSARMVGKQIEMGLTNLKRVLEMSV